MRGRARKREPPQPPGVRIPRVVCGNHGQETETPPRMRCVQASCQGQRGGFQNGFKGAGPAQGRKNGARLNDLRGLALKPVESRTYFMASSTATATETVAPTMGLLPMPRNPIISTWAGTELEPANCASECMRPRVSVKP